MTFKVSVKDGEAYIVPPFQIEGNAYEVFKKMGEVAEKAKDLPDGIHTIEL